MEGEVMEEEVMEETVEGLWTAGVQERTVDVLRNPVAVLSSPSVTVNKEKRPGEVRVKEAALIQTKGSRKAPETSATPLQRARIR